MNFTVVWMPKAEAALAQLWEANPRARAAITRSAFQIDELLSSRPTEAGESRQNGVRILLVPPLGVTFWCSNDDRLVRVGYVWHYDKRRSH
jgi:hypothetical protein